MVVDAFATGVGARTPALIGEYRLLRGISHGLTGTSYLAVSERGAADARLVVAKELRPLRGRAWNEAMRTYAQLATRLEHPNVARTFGIVRHAGSYYWLTEYVDGQPFSRLVQASRLTPQVPLRARLLVIRDMLMGLDAAHRLQDSRGRSLALAHGGLRPSNVLVGYDGTVRVVGFGIAPLVGSVMDWREEPSRLRYAAPEQLSSQEIDARADVFSVGVMLWEAISLRKFVPISQPISSVIQRRLAGDEPAISRVSPQVPVALAHICDKALSVHRAGRFADASELLAALNSYLVGTGTNRVISVGTLVTRKFGGDRAEVHRLLEKVRDERDGTRSSVLRAPSRPLDDDSEPTMVWDGTGLVDRSRITRAIRRWQGPGRSRRWWIFGALLALVFAMALVMVLVRV